MVPAPRNKQEMYPHYLAGEYGNKLITWATVYDFKCEGDFWPSHKAVVLRYKGTPGITPPRYGEAIMPSEVDGVVDQWLALGLEYGKITVNELARDTMLRIQGEAGYYEGILHLRYTSVKKPMRPAMAEESINVHGVRARVILRYYLCEHSYENLMWLLDKYEPGTVVEFSSYDCGVGDLGWNTVFWEVRGY